MLKLDLCRIIESNKQFSNVFKVYQVFFERSYFFANFLSRQAAASSQTDTFERNKRERELDELMREKAT